MVYLVDLPTYIVVNVTNINFHVYRICSLCCNKSSTNILLFHQVANKDDKFNCQTQGLVLITVSVVIDATSNREFYQKLKSPIPPKKRRERRESFTNQICRVIFLFMNKLQFTWCYNINQLIPHFHISLKLVKIIEIYIFIVQWYNKGNNATKFFQMGSNCYRKIYILQQWKQIYEKTKHKVPTGWGLGGCGWGRLIWCNLL